VRRRLALALLAGAAALLAAPPASAQFAAFSRCRAAWPCSEPFHLQYRPDPVTAGPWAADTSSAVSGHIELKPHPKIELDKRPEPPADDPVEASVRYFLRRHPALKPKAAPPRAEPPAPEPERN
jgi:hypothetical protein